MIKNEIVVINPGEKHCARASFVLCFDAYGSTRCFVYARSLENAFNLCVDYIADRHPELLMNKEVAEAYFEAIAEGCDHAEAVERAEMDTTSDGSGNYIASAEWGIALENPSPAELAAYVHGRSA